MDPGGPIFAGRFSGFGPGGPNLGGSKSARTPAWIHCEILARCLVSRATLEDVLLKWLGGSSVKEKYCKAHLETERNKTSSLRVVLKDLMVENEKGIYFLWLGGSPARQSLHWTSEPPSRTTAKTVYDQSTWLTKQREGIFSTWHYGSAKPDMISAQTRKQTQTAVSGFLALVSAP